MNNRTPIDPPYSVIVETPQVKAIKIIRLCMLICIILLTCWGVYLAGKEILLFVHYSQLRQAMVVHDWSDAIDSLEKIKNIDPNYKDIESMDRKIYYEATVYYLNNKNWQEAKENIDRLLSLDEEYENALELKYSTWYEPAMQYFNEGKYNEARIELLKLLAYDSDYQKGISLLFKTYHVEIDQAIKDQNEVLLDKLTSEFIEDMSKYSDKPEYNSLIKSISNAYYSFALSSFGSNNYSVSRSQVEKILNFNPKFRNAILHYLKCCQAELDTAYETKDKKVIDSLAQEIDMNRDRFLNEPAYKSLMESLVFAYYSISEDAEKSGDLDTAISNLEKVLEIDPGYRDCAEKLAKLEYTRDMNKWISGEKPSCSVLQGHTDIIRAVKFSQDGKWFATASKDETAMIWDTSSWSPVRTLWDHSDYVFALDFSSDSKILATGSLDGTAKLWDVQSGKLLYTLDGHNREVVSVAFSPDGKLLATGGMDKTILLWNTATGSLVANLSGSKGDIYGLSFSPDSTILASSSEDKVIRLWNIKTKQVIKSFELNSVSKYIQFNNTGTKLAVTIPDAKEMYLIDVKKITMSSINVPSRIRILDWSVDDKYIILSNGPVNFLDMKTESIATSIDLDDYLGNSGLASLDFSSDAIYLGMGLKNGSVLVCEYE